MAPARRWWALVLMLLCMAGMASAQNIKGRVLDDDDGETLPAVAVYYLDAPSIVTATDNRGRFTIRYRQNRTLVVTCMGYTEQRIVLMDASDLTVRMKPSNQMLGTVEIVQKRDRYKRKGNPAVELIQNVIDSRHNCPIDSLPHCSYTEYQRQTISLDKMRPSEFAANHKKLGFIAEYASVNPHTGDTILPLIVEENVIEHSLRRTPPMRADVVTAHRTEGVTQLMTTGQNISTVVNDIFTDVNIYDDDVRLFQLHFMSPIATRATQFYHYFINDTIMRRGQRCYELMFLPANARDIGFSGLLHVLADSTWQVQHIEVNLPSITGVNYVDRLRLEQEFDTLPGGNRTLVTSDMTASMSFSGITGYCECRRVSQRSNFVLDSIPTSTMRMLAKHQQHPDAKHRSEDFWKKARTMKMSEGEKNLGGMIARLTQMPAFKWVKGAIQVFGENYIETRRKHSRVDIGPVKAMLAGNYVQGIRTGIGAQTTGQLNPHLFADGFIGYGWKDKRPFGDATLTWSFDSKTMRPHEFPVNSLSLSYRNDVMTAADRVEGHNRDNLFTILGMNEARHMLRQQAIRLTYDREWQSGLRVTAELLHERLNADGALKFIRLTGTPAPSTDPSCRVETLTNAQAQLKLRYQPGATYVITKQRRLMANNDAPYVELRHSYAPKGLLLTDYTSNITEMEVHKRFWMYSWGRMDFWVRGGVQWNQVPFPLLLAPLTNQSLMIRFLNFNLINDFEFVNDRYAQLMWRWDLYGKVMNRLPLIKKLGWREYIGANVLWGMLSDRNNPATSGYTDTRLWHMPGEWKNGQWEQFTHPMNPRKPYAEVYVGIGNIFNLISVQYVHRLNYTTNPDISRWGVRFMIDASF